MRQASTWNPGFTRTSVYNQGSASFMRAIQKRETEYLTTGDCRDFNAVARRKKPLWKGTKTEISRYFGYSSKLK